MANHRPIPGVYIQRCAPINGGVVTPRRLSVIMSAPSEKKAERVGLIFYAANREPERHWPN